VSASVLVLTPHSVARAIAAAAEEPAEPPAREAVAEIARARTRAKKVTRRPLQVIQSAHFQAIGDASETFMKLTLSDCDQIATVYWNQFRTKGFDVKLPARRLTVIAFVDERPFHKFLGTAPPGVLGVYDSTENWLAVYDSRNVPMNPFAPGQTNMESL